jgi:hypothetical protein
VPVHHCTPLCHCSQIHPLTKTRTTTESSQNIPHQSSFRKSSELLSAISASELSISPLNFPANIGFPWENLQFHSWFKPWILNRFCRMGKWSATAIRFQVYARWETFCPKP